MQAQIDWNKAIQPLLKKYKGKKHPLEYKNLYQLVVMVVLSAQDSDKHINDLAPALFKAFPNIESLNSATPEKMYPYVNKIRGSIKKTNWLLDRAKQIKKDSNIPLHLDGLTALPGIGRKSANVILREAGAEPQGVIVDLHVVRVAPRLGITSAKNPKDIESDIMQELKPKKWDAGMAMSFHGREICRPTPVCEICIMRKVCRYYQEIIRNT